MQALQQRQHRVAVTRIGHHRGRAQRAATDKDRQPPEQLLLCRRQAVVAPLQGGLQGLLARHGTAATGEEAETVGEQGVDLCHRQHPHPGCRQLDGQGDAVKPAANIGHGSGIVFIDRKAGLGQAGAVDEEPHRFGRLQGRRVRRRWQRQRAHRQHLLTGHAQGLTAGGQQCQLRTAVKQRLGDCGGGVDQVLAVVQHDEGAPLCQVGAQAVNQRRLRLLAHTQHRRQRGGDALRLAQRRQIDKPDAIGEGRHLLLRQLQRQPRLAAAADARQRQQAGLQQQLRALPQAGLAANEPGAQGVQVVGRHCACRQRIGRPDIAVQHRREPVATAGDGGDRQRPQQLAQGRDMHLQGVVFNHCGRPHGLQQVGLAHRRAAPIKQHHQHIKGAAAQGCWHTVDQQ